jgi:uncharacterized membrane protein
MSDSIYTSGDLRSRILAALSYFGVLCFIPLMASKADDYVRFHARQGLVLWGWIAMAGFALYLPGIGKMFFALSLFVVVILSVSGLISVVLLRAWRLPLVYRISRLF